jgi:hypothetical protein
MLADTLRKLEVVCVDRFLRIIQIDRQADPALTDIRQRIEEGLLGRKLCLSNGSSIPGKKRSRTGFSHARGGVRAWLVPVGPENIALTKLDDDFVTTSGRPAGRFFPVEAFA